jgi:ribose 1,5-bisphosphate isomerase
MVSVQKVVADIKSVRLQGAKEIALHALKFFRQFCKKNGFGLKFEVAAYVLEQARPTAVVLHNVIEILKKKKKIQTIDKLMRDLENATKKISRIGQKIVKNNSRILTHCHSGEALSVIEEAAKRGKEISVIVTLTEPLHQGIKTAKELARKKIPVTLVKDLAVGHLMQEVDMVIIGTDAMRKNGFVNKIGTHVIAEEAKWHKKPLYVVGSHFKFDRRKKLVLEERAASEVYPKKLKGVKIRNPAFDLVSWKYVTKVVTDKGIFTPKQIVRLLNG